MLIVDDSIVHLSMVMIIEDGGFDAVEAINADKASCCRRPDHGASVVFTDVDTPGSMDGVRFAFAVQNAGRGSRFS